MAAQRSLAEVLKDAAAYARMSGGKGGRLAEYSQAIVSMQVWIKQLEMKLEDVTDQQAQEQREANRIMNQAASRIEELMAEIRFLKSQLSGGTENSGGSTNA